MKSKSIVLLLLYTALSVAGFATWAACTEQAKDNSCIPVNSADCENKWVLVNGVKKQCLSVFAGSQSQCAPVGPVCK